MILNKNFNVSLPVVIVVTGIFLRILQLIKETYYVNVFKDSLDLSFFISLKANFDLFLVLTSSIYFLESCYNKKKIILPFFPIFFSLLIGIIIYFFKFQYIHNTNIFFLVFIGSLITVFSNCIVILSKESRKLNYNFFANGFENYFLIIIILIFYLFDLNPSFIFFTYSLIFIQLLVSLIIFYKLKAFDFSLKLNYKIGNSFYTITQIVGSTYILLVMIITRILFEINTNIILSNYSLIIASAPLLLFERYHEYSLNKKFINDYSLRFILVLIFLMNSLILIYFDNFLKSFDVGYFQIILINTLMYFFLLLPVFIFFSLCKRNHNFYKYSILTLVLSYIFAMIFSSFFTISHLFLYFSSIISTIFVISIYVTKNKI